MGKTSCCARAFRETATDPLSRYHPSTRAKYTRRINFRKEQELSLIHI